MIGNRQTLHSKSWQDKIDPGFDSMIKTYVEFLDDCEQLPKGYLSLIEKFQDSDFRSERKTPIASCFIEVPSKWFQSTHIQPL